MVRLAATLVTAVALGCATPTSSPTSTPTSAPTSTPTPTSTSTDDPGEVLLRFAQAAQIGRAHV